MRAGIQPTAPGRSSARSSVSSRTRSRCASSRATSPTATRSAWTPRTARSASRSSSRGRQPPPEARGSGARLREMLVIAATERELVLLDGLDTFCCGIGPVEAALQTARVLEERRPDAVLHVGIAGSRTLEAPAVVLGSESVYCDVIDPASTMPPLER